MTQEKAQEIHSIEVVNERIKYYQERELTLIFESANERVIDMNKKLLKFWTDYRTTNHTS